MKATTFCGLVLGLFLAAAAPAAAGEHRLGLGAHSWRPAGEWLDDASTGDESDIAAVLSYQYVPFSQLKLEVDLEFFPNGFGGSGEEAWSPQALVVVGDRWYAAIGAGTIYSQDLEGDFSDPIYIARIGADFPILPRLRLDVCVDQRAGELDGLADANEDTITFAAVVRFQL